MAEQKEFKVSGIIDSNNLWMHLSDSSKSIKNGWCSKTGRSGQGNLGKSFQVRQMLDIFLREKYPDVSGKKSAIEWHGVVDGVIHLTSNDQKICEDAGRKIFKYCGKK